MLVMKPSFSPTKLLVAVSISCASVMTLPTSASAACQPGQAGCVLPVGEAAPLSPTPTAPPPAAPVYEDEGGKSIGWLPIVLGILALGGLALLLLDDDDEPDSP